MSPNIDCTPYLLQLGLTKSRTSLVWIAGPLSGLIMQPIVGVIADRSRSKWGRRRPFMIGGSIVVGICLLILGWTSEIVGIFMNESERVCDPSPLGWEYMLEGRRGGLILGCGLGGESGVKY